MNNQAKQTSQHREATQREAIHQLMSTWRQEQRKVATERREKIIIISLLVLVFFVLMPLMTRYI